MSDTTCALRFPDTSKALDRIRCGIDAGERIAIFGDYDCDGITATAQLVRFFRRQGVRPIVRLPHREKDGYGLKEHIVSELLEKRTQLLITVDTGIASGPEIDRFQNAGVDVIVVDHHEIVGSPPNAHSVIHPFIADTPKPYPCAAGIIHSIVPDTDETDTALACIGTVADIVELKGYNRHLVREGLHILERMREGPLYALKMNSGLANRISSRDIGFRIAPRINAAGRMDDPVIALTALLEGGDAIRMLEKLNTERQIETRVFFEDACKRVEDDLTPFICITHPSYPAGIIGLIAGKLSERYARPALVGSTRGSECTASLRSTTVFDVLDALRSCSHLLSGYGGHARAAGCTFYMRNFEELQKKLSENVCAVIPETQRIPSISIDLHLQPSQITIHLCETLKNMEPFGEGNPEPRFLLENVRLEYPRLVGPEKSHIQAKMLGIKSIGFGFGHLLRYSSGHLDIVCRLGLDTWNSREEPQLFIEDIRLPVHTGASFPSM